jgi:hypothetical protein
MPLYDFRCPDHRDVHDTLMCAIADAPLTLYSFCDFCQSMRDFKRVFGFNHKPGMEEHLNQSVGKPISSMRQYRDELSRKSDEMGQDRIYQTADGEKVIVPGIPVNYKPLEWGDHQAFGATNEGIDASNRERSKLGMPLLPEIK